MGFNSMVSFTLVRGEFQLLYGYFFRFQVSAVGLGTISRNVPLAKKGEKWNGALRALRALCALRAGVHAEPLILIWVCPQPRLRATRVARLWWHQGDFPMAEFDLGLVRERQEVRRKIPSHWWLP